MSVAGEYPAGAVDHMRHGDPVRSALIDSFGVVPVIAVGSRSMNTSE
jgi:hypothetical protein